MAHPANLGAHAATAVSPCLGVGIGLRYCHHEDFLDDLPRVDWLEVHAENYFGGIPLDDLLKIRTDYPVSVHATALSLGSAEGVRHAHVDRLAVLCEQIEPVMVSDHLSWSSASGRHVPDLLPLPYTSEALEICSTNIERVQDRLKRQILIENPSRYLAYRSAEFSEADFLAELSKTSGCGILLDLNNLLVSASNLGCSASAELSVMLATLPSTSIGEIHVAGHAVEALPRGGQLRIDDHGSEVSDEVWAMLEIATSRLGERPVLVEWDTNLPALGKLLAQADRARHIATEAQCRAPCV